MVYQGRTPHYKIPYAFFGDIMDPSEEERIFKTIDNQLYGLIRTHSGGNGMIRNGAFSIAADGGGTYTITCYESTTEPTIEAFINQIFINAKSPVYWTGLNNSTTYYLYIQLVETLGTSSRRDMALQTYASTSPVIPGDAVMIASVAISEPGGTVFDVTPEGRVDVPDLITHIADNDNPHTSTLYQDNIICSGLDVLNNLTFNKLTVSNLQISGISVISGIMEIFGSVIVSGEVICSGTVRFLDGEFNSLTALSGTYGQLIVTSGFTINGVATFQNNILMSGNSLVDGRDIGADAAILEAHLINYNNPHQTTASQLGAISVSGGTLIGNITVISGVSIDGIQPATLAILFSGINVDNYHTHNLSSLLGPTKEVYRSPKYSDTVQSGVYPGEMTVIHDAGRNAYKWTTTDVDGIARLITQQYVPSDMLRVNNIKVTSKVDNVTYGSLDVYLFDTNDNIVFLTGNTGLANLAYTQDTITASGGYFQPGEFYRLCFDLKANPSYYTFVSNNILQYTTISGT